MKRRTQDSDRKVAQAATEVSRPLRRAALATGAALLIGIGLWLTGSEQPNPAVPSQVEQVQPSVSVLAPAQTLSVPQARDVPSDAVATVSPGGVPPPVPAVPDTQSAVAVPEPVVLVSKPTGPVLQLGVFGAQENAQRLREELASKGFPARVESRVVLGPFPDRAAAEVAQAALKRAGQGGGMVVPPSTP